MSALAALVIGVANPGPSTVEGRRYTFGALRGVDDDVELIWSLLHPVTDRTLITAAKDTTVDAIETALVAKIDSLDSGGVLIVYFSGHGVRLEHPVSGGTVYDDCLMASDWPLVDGRLAAVWKRRPNVTVVGIADACHAEWALQKALPEPHAKPGAIFLPRFGAPRGVHAATKVRELSAVAAGSPAVVQRYGSAGQASLLLFSAAQPEQSALERPDGSYFTKALYDAWREESSRASWAAWFTHTQDRLRDLLASAAPGSRQEAVANYLGQDLSFPDHRPPLSS